MQTVYFLVFLLAVLYTVEATYNYNKQGQDWMDGVCQTVTYLVLLGKKSKPNRHKDK